MIVQAYAKINLSLDVIRRREDGYHELEMVMVPLELHDVIEIEIAEHEEISWNLKNEIDDKNTIVKAIHLMRETFQLKQQFKVHVKKHIPMEAGLAGGSSNAAAIMRGICELCGLSLSDEQLASLSKVIGADVPFCVINKPALVKGIGEKIECLPFVGEIYVFLVKPQRGVSTKEAFEGLDFTTLVHPNTKEAINSFLNLDLNSLNIYAKNSLEQTAFKLVPEILELKQSLKNDGFDFVLMSGSGSCLFGLTKDKKIAEKAYHNVKYLSYFKELTKILQ